MTNPAPAPEHHNPTGKAETIATWRSRGRMSVPTAQGTITDILIVRLFETTAVDGLPLDALIEGQVAINAPVKRFGVIFSESPPDWPAYGISVLWLPDDGDGVGRWN